MEELTAVNAANVGVEVLQQDTTAQQGNDGVTAAPATQQPDKPVQTPEDNSKFAQIRRDYEAKLAAQTTAAQRAIDAEYERLYGEEYGIKTKADYDRAIANQQFKQQYGIDRQPLEELAREEARRMLDADPAINQLRQLSNEQQYEKDLKEMQAVDPAAFKTRDDLLAFATREDVNPLIIERGMTPKQAYLLLNHDRLVAEAKEAARVEAIKSVQRNGDVSPGAVGNGTNAVTHYTDAEINRMSTKEIMKNYDAVMASMRRNAKG